MNLNPDYITICYGPNDKQCLCGQIDKELHYFNTSFVGMTREFFLHSKLYILLENILTDFKNRLKTKKGIYPKKLDVKRVSVEDFDKNIREMVKISKASNVGFIIINHNWLNDNHSKYCFTPYNETMMSIANDESVDIINTYDIFSKVYNKLNSVESHRESIKNRFPDSFRDNENYLRLFYSDYVHPTRFAHYLIAEAISKKIALK